jgi:hypothetical protein
MDSGGETSGGGVTVLTPEQFQARKRELIDQERKNPAGWWYLSFADEQPRGFLGAVIVQGQGMITAIDRAHRLRINPGGQVAAWAIDAEAVAKIPVEARERLLSKADLDRIFNDVERVGDMTP